MRIYSYCQKNIPIRWEVCDIENPPVLFTKAARHELAECGERKFARRRIIFPIEAKTPSDVEGSPLLVKGGRKLAMSRIIRPIGAKTPSDV